ncbi:unnamed protein product [Gemmata massiliana]|uniref:Uncharacterized protein n=1 Tax=Gemmata massiliana TaxID=1210884 RepID=A0A6P2D761_9BACT|nr:unnamed protein product [Gemmata massiliana]
MFAQKQHKPAHSSGIFRVRGGEPCPTCETWSSPIRQETQGRSIVRVLTCEKCGKWLHISSATTSSLKN